ncbi:MAG TPA: hypothetical protein VF927_06130 [Solirubrobacteraceae bacterium]
MGKTWVLETETKGTGARVVPYEETVGGRRAERELELVELGGPPRTPAAPAPLAPTSFKVIDVLSSTVLAEDVGVRETIEALEGARSMLDVLVFRWAPDSGRWRLLTLEERRALWDFRGRLG